MLLDEFNSLTNNFTNTATASPVQNCIFPYTDWTDIGGVRRYGSQWDLFPWAAPILPYPAPKVYSFTEAEQENWKIKEKDAQTVVIINLAGVKKENIDLEIENSVLLVEATYSAYTEKKIKYQIPLGGKEMKCSSAKFENGLLTVLFEHVKNKITIM